MFPGTIFTEGFDKENLIKPAITKKLEESDGGQTPEQVAAASVKGLERGEELITTNGILGIAMKSGMLGGSRRNGWGIVDTLVGWLVMIIMVFVRRDMDGKVKTWLVIFSYPSFPFASCLGGRRPLPPPQTRLLTLGSSLKRTTDSEII